MARPPGFSLLLTAPLAIFGLNFHALNFCVSLFGAVGVALLYVHQRPRLGPLLSGLLAATIWFTPFYQTLGNRVMSDVPGLTLLLACLLLSRWASRSPSWRRELLLGLAIGLSAQVRSMDALLLPAILVARALAWRSSGGEAVSCAQPAQPARQLAERSAILALGVMLVLIPWALRNQAVQPPSPVDQVTVYDYPSGMWKRDSGDPASPFVGVAEVFLRIPRRAVQLVHVLGSAMQVNANGNRPPAHAIAPAHALGAATLLLGLLYVLAKRRDPTELFALGGLLVVSVYFGFQNRLVLPLYVIALAATVEMGRDGMRRVASERVALGAVSAALAVLLVSNFEPRAGWDRIRERHLAFASDIAAIAARIGPESCLASSAGFHYSLFLDRPVYSLQMTIRRVGGLSAVESVIDKYGVDTLALYGDKKMEKELLEYARRTYPAGEPVGSGFLFRVRPSSPSGPSGPGGSSGSECGSPRVRPPTS